MFMQKFVLRAAGILATALIVSFTTGDICRSDEKKDTDKKKALLQKPSFNPT
jgi:hypothetical protein